MVERLVRVTQIMSSAAIHVIESRASVEQAAKRMKEACCGCLIVIDSSGPVGIVTERDLVRRVLASELSSKETRILEVMSKPVITVGAEALISDAAKVMIQNRIRRLPVTEGSKVVGIVTATDFAKFLQKAYETDPMMAVLTRSKLP